MSAATLAAIYLGMQSLDSSTHTSSGTTVTGAVNSYLILKPVLTFLCRVVPRRPAKAIGPASGPLRTSTHIPDAVRFRLSVRHSTIAGKPTQQTAQPGDRDLRA